MKLRVPDADRVTPGGWIQRARKARVPCIGRTQVGGQSPKPTVGAAVGAVALGRRDLHAKLRHRARCR